MHAVGMSTNDNVHVTMTTDSIDAVNAPGIYHQKQYVHKNRFEQLPEQLN
jgi:hypothetical protein